MLLWLIPRRPFSTLVITELGMPVCSGDFRLANSLASIKWANSSDCETFGVGSFTGFVFLDQGCQQRRSNWLSARESFSFFISRSICRIGTGDIPRLTTNRPRSVVQSNKDWYSVMVDIASNLASKCAFVVFCVR